MTAAVILLGALLALLLFVLLCPVRYRCRVSPEGGLAEVRLFGGLWKKRVQWPGGEAETDAAEMQEAEALIKEMPLGSGSEEQAAEKRSGAAPQTAETSDGASATEGKPAGETQAAGGAKSSEEAPDDESEAAGGANGSEETPSGEGDERPARPGTAAVLSFAWKSGAAGVLLRAAGRLYRHSRPSFFRLTGRCGLGDPMETGLLAGLLYASLPGANHIDWDYTARVFAVTAEAAGRIVPLYVLIIFCSVLASGPVRRTNAYRRGRRISPTKA